ncbi:MAG TPA: alpha/beta fold hydrolase [Nevskiaceae bacterium]|nr:alpha/beta fold hydrolase [Nevskiaceae bacterium]
MRPATLRGASTVFEGIAIATIEFAAADGARSAAAVFAATRNDAPVVVIWPAMGVPARFYEPFAPVLGAAAGAHVVVPDLRGIGASSLRASRQVNFGYRELVELDCPAAVAAVRAHFPHSPIYLLGHSLGGQVSALYAAREPQAVKGLIFVASGNVWYRGWRFPQNASFLLFTQAAGFIAQTLGYFPGRKLGFGGTEARWLMRDWARTARDGRYRLGGSSFDYEAALAHLQLPLLGIGFAHDHFAPHRAAENLLHKMKAARLTHLKLTAAETEGRKLDHFSWVKQPQPVAQRIAHWLAQQGAVQ